MMDRVTGADCGQTASGGVPCLVAKQVSSGVAAMPKLMPGQTWAPTRVGSQAKPRIVAGTDHDWVWYDNLTGRKYSVLRVNWRRWVRSCDAQPVLP